MHIAHSQHGHVSPPASPAPAAAALCIPDTLSPCRSASKGHGPAGWDQKAQQRGTRSPAHHPAALLLCPRCSSLKYDLPRKFLCAFSTFPVSSIGRFFLDMFSLCASKASLDLCRSLLPVPQRLQLCTAFSTEIIYKGATFGQVYHL